MLGNLYLETYFEYSLDYTKATVARIYVGLFCSKVFNFHT